MRTIRNLPKMNGQEHTGFLKTKMKSRATDFKPDRDFIKNAVDEYTKSGGIIKTLVVGQVRISFYN